jgi:hypothetical protein
MIEETTRLLRRERDAVLHPGASPAALAGLPARLGRPLPAAHLELLAASNGIEVAGGFLRVFGFERERDADLLEWNRPELWKFAWPAAVADHLCFAQSGWGDQYAYPPGRDEVVRIDSQDARVEPFCASFAEFLEGEVLRCARRHYDPFVAPARARLGDLTTDALVAYAPPLLVGGEPSVERLTRMKARAVMVVNGDLIREYDGAPEGARLLGFTPYRDDEGRARMRLRWG